MELTFLDFDVVVDLLDVVPSDELPSIVRRRDNASDTALESTLVLKEHWLVAADVEQRRSSDSVRVAVQFLDWDVNLRTASLRLDFLPESALSRRFIVVHEQCVCDRQHTLRVVKELLVAKLVELQYESDVCIVV